MPNSLEGAKAPTKTWKCYCGPWGEQTLMLSVAVPPFQMSALHKVAGMSTMHLLSGEPGESVEAKCAGGDLRSLQQS